MPPWLLVVLSIGLTQAYETISSKPFFNSATYDPSEPCYEPFMSGNKTHWNQCCIQTLNIASPNCSVYDPNDVCYDTMITGPDGINSGYWGEYPTKEWTECCKEYCSGTSSWTCDRTIYCRPVDEQVVKTIQSHLGYSLAVCILAFILLIVLIRCLGRRKKRKAAEKANKFDASERPVVIYITDPVVLPSGTATTLITELGSTTSDKVPGLVSLPIADYTKHPEHHSNAPSVQSTVMHLDVSIPPISKNPSVAPYWNGEVVVSSSCSTLDGRDILHEAIGSETTPQTAFLNREIVVSSSSSSDFC